MTAIEQLIGRFIEEWNAGRRPDVVSFLDEAPEADRDELAKQLMAWLEIAPIPDYDDETRAAMKADPILLEARARAEELRAPLGGRLARLRAKAGLSVSDLATKLVEAFGVGDEARAASYIEQTEHGELAEGRISKRLLQGLARILSVDPTDLSPTPPFATGQVFMRAETDASEWIAEDIAVLSELAMAAPPPALASQTELDELDRLFVGGPDA